jgi:cytoskeletal protein RodZ
MNESEFPFDEKNWEKARNLIDSNRVLPVAKSSSKNLLFLVLIFISVAGISTFTYFKLSNSPTIISKNNDSKSKNDLGITNSDNANTSNSLAQNESIASTNSEKLEVLNNSNSDINKGNLKSLDENKNVNTTQKNTVNETNATSNELKVSNSGDNVSSSTTYNEKNSESLNSNNNAAKENNTTSNDKTKIGNAINSTANSNKLGQIVDNTGKILAIVDKQQNKVNDEVSENVLQSSTATNVSDNSNDNTFETLMPINTSLESLTTEHECKYLKANFLAIYDGDYYKNSKPKFNYLNVEGGYLYLFGWNVGKIKDAAGFNYYAGVNYGIYLNSKMSISIGLQGYNIGNVKQPFYSASKTVYEFGSTGTYTNITSNALYYVSIPLNFNYSFSFLFHSLALNIYLLFLILLISYVSIKD